MIDKRELFELIVEKLEQDGEDATLHEDYSGRGMYGATCLAISGNFSPVSLGIIGAQAVLDILFENMTQEQRDSCDIEYEFYEGTTLIPTNVDSLGRGIIVY